jgi:hypothetical protein
MRKKARDQRLDKLFIPASTIERMNELNHKTHETGREHGMALCLSPDKRVVPGIESVGDEGSIDISETCGTRKNKYIGSFHTHPRPSETKFSAMDLFSSCDVKSKIDCVGMNRNGEIECYAKKTKKSCQDTAEALVKIEDMYFDIDPEDRKILKSNLLEEVDKLTDKKFISKKIL